MRGRDWLRPLSRSLSLLAAVALSYLAGAAAIFFGLPTSDLIERAFIGGHAWNAQRSAALADATAASPAPRAARQAARREPRTDEPLKTCDGSTLYASIDRDGQGGAAYLIDMRGELVHRWQTPDWRVRLHKSEAVGRVGKVHNSQRGFYGLQLDARGHLLAVLHGPLPIGGSTLVKLDKDSRLLWEYPAPVHHDIDVGDDGTIYAVQTEMLPTPSGVEPETGCEPYSDLLVRLSSEGKLLMRPIAIIDAIRGSPYAMLLSASGIPRDPEADLLHTNFVQVLTPRRAAAFPRFKAGQVLISMRRIHTVAVVDIDLHSVVWAQSGPWRGQHDPQFLDNGHLLIFDNCGGPIGSRVIEYDPETGAFPWWFPDTREQSFSTADRGMAQRLPNGNTLVVDSEGGEIMEVSHGRQVVWSYTTGQFITTARRYAAGDLSFLGGRNARP